jgi:hypothetical protein
VLHGGEFFGTGPGDGQKKSGVAFGLDMVTDGVAESEKCTGWEIVLLSVDGDANLTLENLDGECAVGVVLLHVGGVLHGDEDDAEVVFLEEGLGVEAGWPGFLMLRVGEFLEQIELSDFVDHGSVLQRGCHGELLFGRKFTPPAG